MIIFISSTYLYFIMPILSEIDRVDFWSNHVSTNSLNLKSHHLRSSICKMQITVGFGLEIIFFAATKYGRVNQKGSNVSFGKTVVPWRCLSPIPSQDRALFCTAPSNSKNVAPIEWYYRSLSPPISGRYRT